MKLRFLVIKNRGLAQRLFGGAKLLRYPTMISKGIVGPFLIEKQHKASGTVAIFEDINLVLIAKRLIPSTRMILVVSFRTLIRSPIQ